MDPLDTYRRLRVAASTRTLPADLAERLAEALQEFKEAGGTKSLCACLGLRGNGLSTIAMLTAREQRDVALMAAFGYCHGGDPQASGWRKIRNLSAAIRRYESRGTVAPRPWTPVQAELQGMIERTASTGLPLPADPSSLWRLLQQTPHFSRK